MFCWSGKRVYGFVIIALVGDYNLVSEDEK